MNFFKKRKLKSRDSGARYRAIIELGEHGDASSIKYLIKALHDPASYVREAATEALGKIGGSETVEPLIQMLTDPDDDVRMAVIKALGKVGHESAVQPLMDILFKSTGSSRFTIAEALDEIDRKWKESRFARQMIQTLTDELSDPEESVRLAAVHGLSIVADARSIDGLLGVLDDDNEDIRDTALGILARIGDERVVEPILSMIAIDQTWLHPIALDALGRIGDERAIGPLIDYLCKHKGSDIEVDNNPTAPYSEQQAASRPVKALEKVFRRSAPAATERDLKKAAALQDHSYSLRVNYDSPMYGDGADDYIIEVDLSEVRSLAQEELAKR